MKFLLLTLSSLLVPVAQAHMELSFPFPLRSKFDPQNSSAGIDYNNMRPLAHDGSDFPCLHHHLSPSHVTANYIAGGSYHIESVASSISPSQEKQAMLTLLVKDLR
jgi:hypothetical protein